MDFIARIKTISQRIEKVKDKLGFNKNKNYLEIIDAGGKEAKNKVGIRASVGLLNN